MKAATTWAAASAALQATLAAKTFRHRNPSTGAAAPAPTPEAASPPWGSVVHNGGQGGATQSSLASLGAVVDPKKRLKALAGEVKTGHAVKGHPL